MTEEEFKIIQSYPLEIKIAKTKQRIREAINRFGLSGIYISFSGGKDSTVLLDIARSIDPNILAVYCDTGLEYPEVKEFVKSVDNVEILKPKKNFKTIISEYGYPIISKEQSHFIYEIRNSKSQKIINRRLNGTKKGGFKLAEKWKFLLDAPFKISHLCCYHMKKSPFNTFNHRTGRIPILGTRASESRLRRTEYLSNGGCNSFEGKKPKSQPLSFWTEQDVLNYIVNNNVEIPSIYGEVIEVSNQLTFLDNQPKELKCSGVNRTGCIFCGFGCHLEKSPNRYQKLKKSHPKLYEYVIKGGEFQEGEWKPNNKGLGFGKVLDYIDVSY